MPRCREEDIEVPPGEDSWMIGEVIVAYILEREWSEMCVCVCGLRCVVEANRSMQKMETGFA